MCTKQQRVEDIIGNVLVHYNYKKIPQILKYGLILRTQK